MPFCILTAMGSRTDKAKNRSPMLGRLSMLIGEAAGMMLIVIVASHGTDDANYDANDDVRDEIGWHHHRRHRLGMRYAVCGMYG